MSEESSGRETDQRTQRGQSSGREPTQRTRRAVVRSLAAAGIAGLAGCGGSDAPAASDTPTATGTLPTPSDTPTATRRPTTQTESPPSSRTRSQTASSTETVTDRTVTPGEIEIAEPTEGSLRDRAEQVGTAIQPAVVRIDSDRLPATVAGLFVRESVVVTTASGLSPGDETIAPTVETLDGRRHDTTLLGVDRSDDLAVLRVETGGPTLPSGSPDAITPGTVVVSVGHHPLVGEWVLQFGRIGEVGTDRFTSSLPLPTGGEPVVTLDGSLVGLTTRAFGTNPAADETPPPTEPATVYTDRATHEPIGDVRRVVESTLE